MSDATRRRRGARAALRAAPPWTIALRVKRGRCGARRPHVAAPLRLVPSPFSRVPPGSGRCAAGQMRRLLASGTGLGAAWKATRIWWGMAAPRVVHGRLRRGMPARIHTRGEKPGAFKTQSARQPQKRGCAAPASGQPRHAVPRGRRGRQGREAGRRRHPAHRPEGMCIYVSGSPYDNA